MITEASDKSTSKLHNFKRSSHNIILIPSSEDTGHGVSYNKKEVLSPAINSLANEQGKTIIHDNEERDDIAGLPPSFSNYKMSNLGDALGNSMIFPIKQESLRQSGLPRRKQNMRNMKNLMVNVTNGVPHIATQSSVAPEVTSLYADTTIKRGGVLTVRKQPNKFLNPGQV